MTRHDPWLTYTTDDDGVHLHCSCGHTVPLGYNATLARSNSVHRAHLASLAGWVNPMPDEPKHQCKPPKDREVWDMLPGSIWRCSCGAELIVVAGNFGRPIDRYLSFHKAPPQEDTTP